MEGTRTLSQKGPRPEVIRGMKLAAPIVMGYLPVGFAYGVLARKCGLSDFNTVAMSVIVFAGSAQLIAVGLMASGASLVSIAVTTFIVNLRHLLMSAALSPYLGSWTKLQVALFSFELTDESFAVHSSRFASGDTDKSESFAVNATAQAAWVAGTVLGLAASTLITDVKPVGLDYALPAMFIALLVGQLGSLAHLAVALFAGICSTLLFMGGMTQWNVIAATCAGATLGVILEMSFKGDE